MSTERTLHDQMWAGDYWGRSGALVRAAGKWLPLPEDLDSRAGALSSFSSLHYSAAGNAHARASKRSRLSARRWFWYLRGAYHLLLARSYSWKLVREVGLESMTADQLDIRQSILRKMRARPQAILECINAALRKNPSPHCKALLLVGEAHALERRALARDRPGRIVIAEQDIKRACELAAGVEDSEPAQVARVYRAAAGFWERRKNLNRAVYLRVKARELAARAGAEDQLLKMGAK